jgi:hypothetical protein
VDAGGRVTVFAWVQTKAKLTMRGGKREKIDALVSDQAPGIGLQVGQWADFERDKHKANLTLEDGWKPFVLATGAACGPVMNDLGAASKYVRDILPLHDWVSGAPLSALAYARVMRFWWDASGKPIPAEMLAAIREIEEEHSAERAA